MSDREASEEPSSAASLVAGVDLGGTKIQVAVLRGGTVVGSTRTRTPRSGAVGVVDAIAQAIGSALEEASVDRSDLTAVGIGSPGRVDELTGTVSLASNVPGFLDPVELGPLVSRRLGDVEVRVDNDVRVATRGELERGAGRSFHDFLCLFLGTGVGGGLVIDRRLVRGRGSAGEIGHVVVRDGGRRCSCGRRGCLEAYAGRARIERRARRIARQGMSTSLFRLMERKDRDSLSSGVIAKALAKNDDVACALVEDAAWALGVALSSVQNLLDLEAIVVGGGLGDRLGKRFLDLVGDAMRPHLFQPDDPPRLLNSELGDLSGAVGAAILVGG